MYRSKSTPDLAIKTNYENYFASADSLVNCIFIIMIIIIIILGRSLSKDRLLYTIVVISYYYYYYYYYYQKTWHVFLEDGLTDHDEIFRDCRG